MDYKKSKMDILFIPVELKSRYNIKDNMTIEDFISNIGITLLKVYDNNELDGLFSILESIKQVAMGSKYSFYFIDIYLDKLNRIVNEIRNKYASSMALNMDYSIYNKLYGEYLYYFKDIIRKLDISAFMWFNGDYIQNKACGFFVSNTHNCIDNDIMLYQEFNKLSIYAQALKDGIVLYILHLNETGSDINLENKYGV